MNFKAACLPIRPQPGGRCAMSFDACIYQILALQGWLLSLPLLFEMAPGKRELRAPLSATSSSLCRAGQARPRVLRQPAWPTVPVDGAPFTPWEVHKGSLAPHPYSAGCHFPWQTGTASSLLRVLPSLFFLSISFLTLENQELAVKASHKMLQTIASFVLSSWTDILAQNSQRWESAANPLRQQETAVPYALSFLPYRCRMWGRDHWLLPHNSPLGPWRLTSTASPARFLALGLLEWLLQAGLCHDPFPLPWEYLKPGWIRPPAAWSRERCPCPWQEGLGLDGL